jgi:D-alanine-D-alanine ligase
MAKPDVLTTPRLRLHLDVILADPTLPNLYHPDGGESEHDRRDVARLRDALQTVVGEGRVSYLRDHRRLLDELQTRTPDLVLNFCNAGLRNLAELQMHVPALLEMCDRPFAGADAACLAVCHDKAGVYAAAEKLGIPVPRHRLLLLETDPPELPDCYPVLLKPNEGSGSAGITIRSLVRDPEQAAARLDELRRERTPPRWVLADGFLPGRELTIAVLGPREPDQPPRCLPPLEIGYERLDQRLPRIMPQESKADENSDYWRDLDVRPAELPADVLHRIEQHALAMFARLGCRDYARFDFRCDEAGVPHLIDANGHPEWGAESLVAVMAGIGGMSYEALLDHIVASALWRQPPRRPARADAPTTTATADETLGAGGVRLRPTALEDLEFVRNAESAEENRSYIEQWTAQEHRAAIAAADTRHLIIEDTEGRPAGYVILQGLDDPAHALLLRRIVVTRKGQGIGGRAVDAVAGYCFDVLGFRRLWLEVDADNVSARHLYEHHGFATAGRHTMVRMALDEADYRPRSRPPDRQDGG